jgi:hypothetical protein
MIARQIIRPGNVETAAPAIICARRYVTRGTARLLSVSELLTGEKSPRRRSHNFTRNYRLITSWRVVVYPHRRTAEIRTAYLTVMVIFFETTGGLNG